jgi:hypothetical protein
MNGRDQQDQSAIRIPNSRANIFVVKTAHVLRRNPMEARPTTMIQRQVATHSPSAVTDMRTTTFIPMR